MTVLIFANGEINKTEWIKPYLDPASVIIAADGGAEHLRRLGTKPDILIGDLDSISSATLEDLLLSQTKVIEYPEDKDETDLELTLVYAASHFTEKIQIFGALGGRLDQTIGNILLLAHPDLDGREIEVVEERQTVWVTKSLTTITGSPGDVLSLIPLSDDVHLRETTGLRWNLEEEMLAFGLARGISNVLTSESASIVVRSGVLLCIHSHG